MAEVITIALSVGSVLSVCLHLSHGLHELQAKKQLQASLNITALSTGCLTAASLLSQLQSLMLERFEILCTAASAKYNWMASIETAIMGIASTLSVLDAEIHRLSSIGHPTELGQGDLLDGSMVREIEEQIRGHRLSVKFLTEFLKTECLKIAIRIFQAIKMHKLTEASQLIPGIHLQPPDGANAFNLKELERRSLEAKAFRDSKLKGKISNKRTDFHAESTLTFESTEKFGIRKEQLINNSFEPQFSLEVIEKLFQVTREHTEIWDRQIQDLSGEFELGEGQFQLELRDSRPYRKAGFTLNQEITEFRQESAAPSPSNLTITTEAEKAPPKSLYAGSDFRYNQAYGHYQSYSVLERISVISEPREVQLHQLITRQDVRAVSDLLERGADPHFPKAGGLATNLWSYPPPVPPLVHAAVLGNTSIVELLIEHGAMVESHVGDGKTALICASIEGQANTVKFLLARGALVDHSDEFGMTPLLYAASRGYKVVTDLLIQHGADLNVQALHDGRTALITAASKGHVFVVESLLEHQADMNIAAHNGFKPIHAAANTQQDVIISLLVRNGADVDSLTENEDGWTPLHVVAACNGRSAIEALVELDAYLNARAKNTKSTPLGVACEHENSSALEALLEAGADFSRSDAEDNTVLDNACRRGHVECVASLLKYGAYVNRGNWEGFKPLHHAASQGHTNVITKLLNNGPAASINDTTLSGWTPLHYAVKNGHLKAAEKLLTRGAKADIQVKPQHETPLWIAVDNNNTDMLTLLLNNGASQLTTRQTEHSTHFPLHVAAMNDCVEVCKLLLNHGGDVNVEDDNKSTPLHYAALRGHQLVLVLLYRYQANLNHADLFGYTALHIAISTDQANIARWLIIYGADVNYKSLAGVTPLHVAAWKGDKRTTMNLLDHGADRTALANKRRPKGQGIGDERGKTAANIARGAGHHDLARFIDVYENPDGPLVH